MESSSALAKIKMELLIVVQACLVKLKRSNFGSAYKNVECLLVNALKFDVEILIYPTLGADRSSLIGTSPVTRGAISHSLGSFHLQSSK